MWHQLPLLWLCMLRKEWNLVHATLRLPQRNQQAETLQFHQMISTDLHIHRPYGSEMRVGLLLPWAKYRIHWRHAASHATTYRCGLNYFCAQVSKYLPFLVHDCRDSVFLQIIQKTHNISERDADLRSAHQWAAQLTFYLTLVFVLYTAFLPMLKAFDQRHSDLCDSEQWELGKQWQLPQAQDHVNVKVLIWWLKKSSSIVWNVLTSDATLMHWEDEGNCCKACCVEPG